MVKTSDRRIRNECGFALLLVLVALAVLSLIIASVVEASRRARAESSLRFEEVDLQAAMDAALATVSRDFADAGVAAPDILLHGQSFVIGRVEVNVSARFEAAKIDINDASPDLLRAFLTASGLKPKFAERISDEIVDWRDADSTPRPHGAETADYLFAGRSYGPPNRSFQSLAELGLLLDGSADLATCLEPDLTVFIGRSGVDQAGASSRVRAATITIGAAAASPSVLSGAIVGGRSIQAGNLFEIALRASDAYSQAQSASRRLVVRMTGNPREPVWILSQVAPIPSSGETDAACARLRRAHPD